MFHRLLGGHPTSGAFLFYFPGCIAFRSGLATLVGCIILAIFKHFAMDVHALIVRLVVLTCNSRCFCILQDAFHGNWKVL